VFELEADLDESDRPLTVGWRGIIDFGEVWSESDSSLWPGPGPLPVGKPLVYGCEVLALSSTEPTRARLTMWALDAPRDVMNPGATVILKQGTSLRATGKLV
jgi:hypothetical protein